MFVTLQKRTTIYERKYTIIAYESSYFAKKANLTLVNVMIVNVMIVNVIC